LRPGLLGCRIEARSGDGLAEWTPAQIAAWTGVTEGQRGLAREVESELEARHGSP
jgi:hypothetical protein